MGKTREVLISEGFGAGWASWACKGAQELAEDKELVAMVIAGTHIGRCTYEELVAAGCFDGTEGFGKDDKWDASLTFCVRAHAICGEVPYCGGVKSLRVEEVHGPYRINEYDGAESVETAGGTDWW